MTAVRPSRVDVTWLSPRPTLINCLPGSLQRPAYAGSPCTHDWVVCVPSESVPAIELVPYDEEWPARFNRAKARIAAVLPRAETHHVGSTSVPGLLSKPTVDVMVCLERAARSEQVIEAMEAAGYEYRPQSFAGSRERHLFFRDKADGRRREHVHVVDAGSSLARDYLAFRDYLREHPAETDAYAAAKLRLLRESGGDRAWYVDNKIPIVNAMMSEARRWYDERGGSR